MNETTPSSSGWKAFPFYGWNDDLHAGTKGAARIALNRFLTVKGQE
jgi:hypothetical protein